MLKRLIIIGLFFKFYLFLKIVKRILRENVFAAKVRTLIHLIKGLTGFLSD